MKSCRDGFNQIIIYGISSNMTHRFIVDQTFSYNNVPNTLYRPSVYICSHPTLDHLGVGIIHFYASNQRYYETIFFRRTRYHSFLDYMIFLSTLWNRKLISSKIHKKLFFIEIKKLVIHTKIVKTHRECKELSFFYLFWKKNIRIGYCINIQIIVTKMTTFVVTGKIWVNLKDNIVPSTIRWNIRHITRKSC